MPLVQTRGAASAQGFGEFAQAVDRIYIEDVFNTFIWTGTGGQAGPFVTGVDLLNKGGLLWTKSRSNAFNHYLMDTVRGNGSILTTNNTAAAVSSPNCVNFYADGFKDNFSYAGGTTQVSWTFREQAKFFDIVTYTGNGLASNVISHNLGSVPGFIICKRTDGTSGWALWHRGNGTTTFGLFALNSTDAASANIFAAPTSTTFDAYNIWDTGNPANAGGATYVAYLFAHNAGGFGLTGTDNVISCGSYTGNGSPSGQTITLGYEPQFIITKAVLGGTSGSQDWAMSDNMRGWTAVTSAGTSGNNAQLLPNTTSTETNQPNLALTSTGFQVTTAGSDFNGNGNTYIYIAIRRGPMKVPTDATKVFAPTTSSATAGTVVTTDFPVDAQILGFRTLTQDKWIQDRLRRVTTTGTEVTSPVLATNAANAEISNTGGTRYWDNIGFQIPSYSAGYSTSYWNFRRAPSFFDEVCYTGTGVARTISHNLAAVPELMIIKQRSSTNSGVVYTASGGTGVYLRLFDSSSSDSGNTPTTGDEIWNSTTPTSSVFSVNASARVNGNASTYVAYLFATCAGVSKVGSYTGTGATQTINCGFTGGARFVLIKKSTQTAPDRDWYVWDTARGMVSGTDPSLKLNTTAAEVNADNIYTVSTGFQIVSSADYVNASGVTYIFLAIA